MELGDGKVRGAKNFIDKAATKQVQEFSAPSFGEGPDGTLHGGRSDADGYKFLTIVLFGSPKIKCVKGCKLEFKSKSGTITCSSDTKDIESIYSEGLAKGITAFEIYLDDELYRSLKAPITSVTMTFPRKLFGKDTYSFDVRSKAFTKVIR